MRQALWSQAIGCFCLPATTLEQACGLTGKNQRAKEVSKLFGKKDALDCHYSSPVALGEFAYGFHGRQERGPVLRCISLKDGTVIGRLPSMGAGNLIRVKDKLIVLTEDGELILWKPPPRDSGLFIGSKFSVRAPGPILAWPMASSLPATNAGLFACDWTNSSKPLSLRPRFSLFPRGRNGGWKRFHA